jgi:hypothetical protein
LLSELVSHVPFLDIAFCDKATSGACFARKGPKDKIS